MSVSAYKPFTLKAALELAGPPSLVAAVMPVLVGGIAAIALSTPAVLAAGTKAWIAWILMLVTAILMQVAVNSLNDYHDFLVGTDTVDTILDEHDASIVYNGIDPKAARSFAIVLLIGAAATGIGVVLLSSWHLLVVGIVAAFIVVLYSVGPKPISYLPIGELVSGVVMGGFITGATYYAMAGVFTPLVLVVAVPPIITIALIMQTNNTCDIERDIVAGRRTLPVLLGRERSIKLASMLSWSTLAWMTLALMLASIFIWGSLLLVFVCAILAGSLYFLLRKRLDAIAEGSYNLINRGAMMGNSTGFCRVVNQSWTVGIFICWLLGGLFRVI